jgi:hypothetical protein
MARGRRGDWVKRRRRDWEMGRMGEMEGLKAKLG